jgi:hypothetical protein
MPGSSGSAGGDDGGEEGNPLMDIIARFPRLPTEAVEEAPTSPTHLEPLPEPAHAREVSCRLGGGKSLVAVGRGGPRLLERLPTPSPTSCVSVRSGATAKQRSVRQPAFPGLSVVLLAVVAAVVWSLAAWNDSVRLARQQRPERLAARPVVSSQTASP